MKRPSVRGTTAVRTRPGSPSCRTQCSQSWKADCSKYAWVRAVGLSKAITRCTEWPAATAASRARSADSMVGPHTKVSLCTVTTTVTSATVIARPTLRSRCR